jgi:predicted nucleic acid-binding protein
VPEDEEASPGDPHPLVADTTVLINFGRTGAFQLLRGLYSRQLMIASEVEEEVQDTRSRRSLDAALKEGWIEEYTLGDPEELFLFGNLLGRLEKGEAASLALAKVQRWRWATDDKKAREIAKGELHLTVTGSIGILVKAVRQGICTVDEADRWHRLMRRQGYHSPITSIRELFPGD